MITKTRARGLALLASVALTVGLSGQAQAAPAPEPAPLSTSSLPHPGLPSAPARNPKKTSNLAPNWIWQNPRPDGDPLFGISCPNATICYALGLGGPIMKTTDGGATWTQQMVVSGMFAISCADATHCVAVGYGGQVLTTTDGASWSSSAISNIQTQVLLGVSCPSITNCFAVGTGGLIFATTNGGATWSSQTSGTANYLYAVSCPSTTTCVAVGAFGTILGTTNGGGTWTVSGASASFLYAISCVSTTLCIAVGAQGTVLTIHPGCCWVGGDIGAPNLILWGVSCQPNMCFIAGGDGNVYQRNPLTAGSGGVRASPGANGGLFAISCPTSSTCFAAGNYRTIVVTTNGGTGWALQTGLPSSVLYGISCPSTTVCFAVGAGGEVATTSNGGTAWSTQTSGTTSALTSISCPSTTTCVAVGLGGAQIHTTNGGALWATGVSTNFSDLQAVSCPSTTLCLAVTTGANYIKTTDGGATWSAPTAAGAALGLTSINCPSTTVCFATDADNPSTNLIYRTGDGGSTWTQSFNLANDPAAGINVPFGAISCPNITTCYAAGSMGIIAATSDGGANWRTDFSPSSATLTGVSCPAAGNCYISSLDNSILHTTDFGARWQSQAGFDVYRAISCPSTTTCFAVGQNGNASATTTAGFAWTVVQPTGPTDTIRGLSCYGFANCYAAADGTLLATHDGGNTWASHVLGTTDLLEAISCPAANTCYAVGWPAAIYKTTDGGTTWTLQANMLYGSDNTFLGVSCPAVNRCVLVGNGGIILGTSDGTNWSSQASGTTTVLWAVSCPAANACVAVGSSGVTVTDTGAGWTANPSITTQNLHGVSCTLPDVCYAVGNGGGVFRTANRGASWMPQLSGTTLNLYGISCPLASSTCMAVGAGGTVLQSLDGVSWNNIIDPDVNTLRAVYYLSSTHTLIAGFGGAILAVPSCTSATLTSNLPPPQAGGTTVTFTATATGAGCTSPLYQFWMWTAATGWVLKQAYSSNAQFVLNTTGMAPGTYTVDAWAEESGSALGTNNYETFGLEAWVVGGCDSATLTPNPAPTTGTVLFTASSAGAGCIAPQYQWWLWSPATGWVLKQPYSTTSTFSLNVDGLAPATYSVDVWVKQTGSPSTYETWALSSIPKGACGATTVSATQTSPQPVGTTINLSTVTTGCGTTPSYRYWDYPSQAGVGPNALWTMLRDYSTTGTFDWPTAGYKTGTQSIVVHVRQAGSTAAYDTDGMISYSLTGCSAATLTAGPSSPQQIGSTVMLIASSSGCSAPQYQFWVYQPGLGWSMVQNYSSSATYNWNTQGIIAPGTYAWVVFVKQQGSANDHDTYALFSDTVS